MRPTQYFPVLLALLLPISTLAQEAATTYIQPAASLPESMPWDLRALSEAPPHAWVETEEDGVRALTYPGESYQGRDTRVFAYYATPATLDPDAANGTPYPGIVLIHGGGGTAFPEWVRLWAERGYAAISMDLAGCGANREPLPDGGPNQSDDTKFGAIAEAPGEQWSYHAVANAIKAHSLMRSFPEIDAARTAVTGVSWGGYLTCIVAGLDNRFKAAVPVYGCGFLHEESVWLPRFAAMTPAHREKWVRLWDPSMYVGAASMPVFFVNGTNDFAYWLESYAKTYALVEDRNLRITVNMPHNQRDGSTPEDIYRFVESKLNAAPPMSQIAAPQINDGRVTARVSHETEVAAAELHYTTSTAANKDREWETVPATVEDGVLSAPSPPKEARIWFLTLSDARGAVVSSELVFPGQAPTP